MAAPRAIPLCSACAEGCITQAGLTEAKAKPPELVQAPVRHLTEEEQLALVRRRPVTGVLDRQGKKLASGPTAH